MGRCGDGRGRPLDGIGADKSITYRISAELVHAEMMGMPDKPAISCSETINMIGLLASLRIGQRLAVGFGLPALLCCVLVAFGMFGLQRLDNSLTMINEHLLPRMEQVNALSMNVAQIGVAMRNAGLYPDEARVRSEVEEIAQRRANIDKLLASLDKTIADPQAREKFEALQKVRLSYRPLQNRYIDLVKAGSRDEALRLLVGTTCRGQSRGKQAKHPLAGNNWKVFCKEAMAYISTRYARDA